MILSLWVSTVCASCCSCLCKSIPSVYLKVHHLGNYGLHPQSPEWYMKVLKSSTTFSRWEKYRIRIRLQSLLISPLDQAESIHQRRAACWLTSPNLSFCPPFLCLENILSINHTQFKPCFRACLSKAQIEICKFLNRKN